MCKHLWQPILPDTSQVDDPVGYYVDTVLRGGLLPRSVYCPLCCRSGHKAKSRRGAIKLHHSPYFLEQANKIREKYGLPVLPISPVLQ